MCPHTSLDPQGVYSITCTCIYSITLYVSAYVARPAVACCATTLCVSSYYDTCPMIHASQYRRAATAAQLLYMCPHTTIHAL